MASKSARMSGDGLQSTDVLRKKGDINAERAAMGAIDVEAKTTVYVVLACFIAASGGLLFGEILGHIGSDLRRNCSVSAPWEP